MRITHVPLSHCLVCGAKLIYIRRRVGSIGLAPLRQCPNAEEKDHQPPAPTEPARQEGEGHG